MIHHAVIQVCLIKLIAYFMNKVSKYNQEMPQSQSTDTPMAA